MLAARMVSGQAQSTGVPPSVKEEQYDDDGEEEGAATPRRSEGFGSSEKSRLSAGDRMAARTSKRERPAADRDKAELLECWTAVGLRMQLSAMHGTQARTRARPPPPRAPPPPTARLARPPHPPTHPRPPTPFPPPSQFHEYLQRAEKEELGEMYWEALSQSGEQHDVLARRNLHVARDLEPEAQARAWVGAVAGKELPALAEAPLQPSLASGVVLCAVANAMRPGIVPKVARDSNVVGLNPEVQTRRQRENIANFLEAAAELGLERRELFNVADLHDNRNWKGVLKTILALAKADVPGYHGPRLGGSKKGYRATSMLQGRRPGGSLLVTQAGSGRDRGVSADLANERAKNAPMQSQHF